MYTTLELKNIRKLHLGINGIVKIEIGVEYVMRYKEIMYEKYLSNLLTHKNHQVHTKL